MRAPAPGKLAAVTLALVAAYAGVAVVLLRFDLDGLLFPRSPAPTDSGAFTPAFRLPGHDGAAMIVRRFDRAVTRPVQGCVVFFPGQRGGLDRYANSPFPELAHAGLVVYAVAYPGQDGAPGRARIDDVQTLAATAVAKVVDTCGRAQTVVLGRSLGAMIAAYAAGALPPAGLVMESAAPSLSAGIRGALRERWYLRPLALLPIERIVPHDFSIAEAVPAELHAAIFQGSADTRTPLADFGPEPGEPARMPLVVVPGGTHTDTLQRATPAIIATMLGMIHGSEEALAARVED
jgi:pimeloyl-ACP methyl ester carboxylesterase